MEPVPSAESKLKNVGELVFAQDVCFIELIVRIFITVHLYIQVIDWIEFPFGNYQPSGNLEYKIGTTVFLVSLYESLDIV